MTDLAVVNLDTGEIVDRDTGEVIDRSQIRFATVAVRDLTPQKHNTRTASESLIETIRQDGLHEPLTVSPSLTITGGHRRYRAVQILGWETVPVIIDERLGSDEEYAVRTELTLNEEREPFTALERAELARRLEVLVHGPAAKARQEASQAQPGNDLASKSRTENGGGPQEPPPFGNGKARDAAAREAGMSPTTYRRITTVRNATKDDTLPDDVRAVAAQALQDIEAGGAIAPAYDKVRQAKKDSRPANGWTPSAERAEQIRALAAKALSTRQIAERIGIGEPRIRVICKAEGIEVPADKIIGRTRRHDPNRILFQTVHALEGVRDSLNLVDWDAVDWDSHPVKDWVDSLTASIKSLNQMRNKVKEQTQ